MQTPAGMIRTVNPATGAPLAEVPESTPAQVKEVVARARAARGSWAADFEARARALRAATQRVTEAAALEALARSITAEMGKPITEARAEIRGAMSRIDGYIDRARAALADERGSEHGLDVVVSWRPLGVVAVIAPWNYPVATPFNLLAAALLTGNTAIFKPSEYTPQTGATLHALLAEGLGEGVLGLVQGGGAVGAALVASDVDMIAFTGSIATGQAIMREAAGSMKRLVLELGGKDPMIVLPGADLAAAARHAARESVRNAGQVCVSVERVIVHRDIADEFTRRVAEEVARVRVGAPELEGTEMGPMVSEGQRARVLAQLVDAREKGAKFVVEGACRGPGFFLEPTVLDDVTTDMIIAREETFGPVVAIERADDTERAIALANDSHYGLGASVWGPEGAETEAVADRVEAGMVGVNRGLSAAAGAPWVGWKMSGYGYTRSVAGMRQFLQPRSRTSKTHDAAR